MVGKSDTDERFARNVRRIRARRELSQAAVSLRMAERGWSWHQQTVAKVESGDRPVQLGEAEALAEVLEVELWELTRPDPEAELVNRISTRNVAVVRAAGEVRDAVLRLLHARRELDEALKSVRHPSRVGTSVPEPQVEAAMKTIEGHTAESALGFGRALFDADMEHEHAQLYAVLQDGLLTWYPAAERRQAREDGGDGEHSETP